MNFINLKELKWKLIIFLFWFLIYLKFSNGDNNKIKENNSQTQSSEVTLQFAEFLFQKNRLKENKVQFVPVQIEDAKNGFIGSVKMIATQPIKVIN